MDSASIQFSASLLDTVKPVRVASGSSSHLRALALSLAVLTLCCLGTLLHLYGSISGSSPSGGGAQSDGDRSLELTPSDVALAAAGAVVGGDRAAKQIFFAFGDWGRCGGPTNNPATRLRRCNEQRSLVPSMEAYAVNLAPSLILSTGDNYYDGPDWPTREQADADAMWSLSWRHVYDRPTLRSTPWWLIQGNHDYMGLLSSQINWGQRTPHTNGEVWDARWNAPDVNFTLWLPIGNTGQCVSLVAIDTCPMMDTYRIRAGSGTGDPDRPGFPSTRGPITAQISAASQRKQLEWLRGALREASYNCSAVVLTGHHSVFSRGQGGQSIRQQDLRTRVNFPEAFAWAGVDQYVNGHDHIAEVLYNAGTSYVVTGAGSSIRTNNAPAAGDDDAGDDGGGAAPGNPSAALSQYLLEDNAFTVHSFNATTSAVAIVSYNGSVMYYQERPLMAKLQRGGPNPPIPTIPGCNPNDPTAILRGECLTWLK